MQGKHLDLSRSAELKMTAGHIVVNDRGLGTVCACICLKVLTSANHISHSEAACIQRLVCW